MKMKKRTWILILLTLVLSLTLVACSSDSSNDDATNDASNEEVAETENVSEEVKTIKVGTRSVTEDILKEAKKDFEAKGYEMEIVLFDDNIILNTALDEGSIDANFYQHIPFLEQFNKDRGTDLTYTGKHIFYGPIKMFSDKYDSIDELPDGAKVAIPNDMTNQEKALKLLIKEGLIKLEEGAEAYTVLNIAENIKNLELIEMDQFEIPNAMQDVDAVIVNVDYLMMAGFDISNPISTQSAGEEYPIIIAIRPEDKDEQWVKDLEDSMTTDHMRDFILERYEGAYTPMF